MDICQLKFTKLQQEILRFLFIHTGKIFNQKNIADELKVSPTAISKSIKFLETEKLITLFKDQKSQTLQIGLNLENPDIFGLKRAENLKMFYESGLPSLLSEHFSGATIILFGSYAFGEDNKDSDMDIAVIGVKEKSINLEKYEKLLGKPIIIQFYDDFSKIHKNLRESLFNGILIKGGIRL